ncbi:hypothetical protein DV495_002747 [Geotrichum candidum]|uniref:Similar to Saccharomyces cerevisiae YEL063C CAN1 Plasma membrane arginine permease n=1 Tax=Geotrichum candidum TaxID=1173061 RepID=A0A0J9XFE8_GEOCN|nr:hypothetical protein DV452_001346 [Geotrichum candidum]KAF5128975.1 hypothetical protein DV495_002747 [Geotrichum candidum]KAF7498625.1 hypothetical protein DV113_003332 [Geotrichum candidum]KAI9212875.1 hypothetical protein DS838_002253 [Geotrichum bryndzae]CDO56113.1 similar to Saccharomyces cerevisiae YEL063C CAN1 Plasma membrane arginine permease [Geotrichum candidum]
MDKSDHLSYDLEKDRIPSPQVEEFESSMENTQVKRGLKQRHVSMIALGGTIGTGLFIGTGSAIGSAGPAGSFISYCFFATVVYSLANSIGEMATYIPITGSFTVFCSRFVSPALGASIGWLYWFSWAITFAIELSIVGQVIEFWTFAVPIGAWIAIFFVIFTALNFLPVKFYGEIEFWAASIKVIAVVGWLIYALCMICGAGQTGPVGFRYWKNPGAFGPGILVSNPNGGKFLGWLSSLVNAAFTFQGTELVGITAGESDNPRKTVPRAINRVFFRIVIFYILAILFLGMLVPYNDPLLSSSESYAASSPFIIAIINSGTKILPSIFNAVILTTIISAGNSNVYIGSRLLYALALGGVAPKFFLKTTRSGVPWTGVVSTCALGLLAFMVLSQGSNTVFNWLVTISTVAGLLTWASISYSHIRFMKALEYNGISRDSLPFKAKLGAGYAWYALICNVVVVFIQGFTCFWDFSAESFLTNYISVFLFVALYLIFQFVVFRDGFKLQHPIETLDIDSGRREVDSVDWDALENKNMTWYEKILEFLF